MTPEDILKAIKENDPVKTAELYAEALVTHGAAGWNWPKINGAIMEQWGYKTLKEVKKNAWKIARKRTK